MKKTIILIILINFAAISQVFDEPIDSTKHYNLRLYAQGARVPAAILNEDKQIIDSVLYSLIVYTDTLQFIMVSDTAVSKEGLTFKISNYSNGISSFSGTNEEDTFTVSGTDTLDINKDLFFLQPLGNTISANDVLTYYFLIPRSVVVKRLSGGTNNLNYSWRWIKRY